jgi:hypothetical protein
MQPTNPVNPTAIANQHAKATKPLNLVSALELNDSMLPTWNAMSYEAISCL